MSFLRLLKYSSLLFFLRKYRGRIFRIVAVLLFALVTNILYRDIADYLELRHPGALVWALVSKIAIVYGALAFVLWQFRPQPQEHAGADTDSPGRQERSRARTAPAPDRLSALTDIDHHDRLRTRYQRLLDTPGKARDKTGEQG